MADGRSADPGERNFLAKEFVEFVVRSDPGPLNRITMPFADHTNISAYSNRPIIWVTAKFFELKRIVSRILQEQSKGASRRPFLRGIQSLIRLPKAPSSPGNHMRFKSSGSLPSAVACSMNAFNLGRGIGSLMICSQRSSSTCASSRNLSRMAWRSAGLSFGNCSIISAALTREV